MEKIRRDGYVFATWTSSHSPRQVRVYRDGAAVLRWDLDHRRSVSGRANERVLEVIGELEAGGLLR